MMKADAGQEGQRGPLLHKTRDEIIKAAGRHFSRNGYRKTSVADLAREIGVTPAYIYRFFESKQAIGEAICRKTLGIIDQRLDAIAKRDTPASDRLRAVFKAYLEASMDLSFNDRKLHETVIIALREKWPPLLAHHQHTAGVFGKILKDGREEGEFDRKTALPELTRAVFAAVWSLSNPLVLEGADRADVRNDLNFLTSLILRGLSP